ncbi:putative UDP-rhamnose:rhamnosyltransferase 1 [Pistacia vera]|uniref:putative UDP-rhamnose:rhamnosyltransferase 1 n=1 Tax=Pistacia vera TaxID=55513 RepID=UPI0012630C01|nr:putative UDP-rhamnose:rhamnosyltransferase 1 [Pistacia vera]XP_031263473.1 putative UDP-rhamnose:rhamnosyltransferase 1 [Pistacia vera]
MATPLHVAMLPWSAFGHLMPFFQLSIALAKSGVKVSFISTPKIIQRLPKPPPNLATLINLVEFPLPAFIGNELLPEGAEATVDLPSFDKIQYLKIAYDLLQHPFKQFVAEQSPDWIFCDVLTHWAVKIAQEYEVPLLHFSVFSASMYAFLGPDLLVDNKTKIRQSPESLTVVPEWVKFSSWLALRIFEASGAFDGLYGLNASGISDIDRAANVLYGCQAIAIRSCPEYEGEYLNLFEKIIGKPVIPVGLLTPENVNGRDQITDERWKKIFQWLDEQKPKSVVFVGFGSECKLTRDQVYEMAYGLELSGLPFLWALRKPEWASDDLDALPPGFGDRVHGKGMICIGWAPQLEILGHSSIGGSLFHAGWGSIIETLQFGHCLVVLPFIIDQPLNARVLVEKGLAVEVERSEDGSFSRNEIAKALTQAMVSEEGEKLRVKARKATMNFNNKKLQEDYFVRFVEYLKTNAVKKQE